MTLVKVQNKRYDQKSILRALTASFETAIFSNFEKKMPILAVFADLELYLGPEAFLNKKM